MQSNEHNNLQKKFIKHRCFVKALCSRLTAIKFDVIVRIDWMTLSLLSLFLVEYIGIGPKSNPRICSMLMEFLVSIYRYLLVSQSSDYY
jgi:hypothetical protein